jgi:hypothetical protein
VQTLPANAVYTSIKVIAIEWNSGPNYIQPMRSGIFKQSVIAALVVMLASIWLVVPSLATQPCETGNGTVQAANLSCLDNHCKSVMGGCTKATICCSISTNLALPSVRGITPVDWGRVSYPDNFQSLNGRSLEPALHPPTARL